MTNVPDDLSFPGQPQHPDFWKLSAIVLKMDADSQDKGVEEVMAEMGFDADSMVYVAKNRCGLFLQVLGLPPNGLVPLQSAWVDGFVAGMAAGKTMK
jgi:hypothetical protein